MSHSKTFLEDQQENSEKSFVSRWSRLKHGSRIKHETQQDTDRLANNTANNNSASKTDNAATKKPAAEINSLADETESLAKNLTDEDMPDIESMTADSDYTDFLSPGVSEALRKIALRKLFHSEVFNIRDGLDEYDGDYTQFEKLGSIVTSDMQHQIEMEAQRKAKQLLQDKEQRPDDAEINVIELENNKMHSTDDDRVTANNQQLSDTQHDQAQTLSIADDHGSDNNTGVETIVDKEMIKNTSLHHDE